MHPAINQAVLELVALGRVTATSAMVNGAAWAQGASALQQIDPAQLDVGLHFDVTELSHPDATVPVRPLRQLWQTTYTRGLRASAVRQEVARQLDAFEAALGRAPAYIDGHQHVHQLPQIREAIMQELQVRYGQSHPKPWLRDTRAGAGLSVGLGCALKSKVIEWLGRGALVELAHAQGFATNRSLLGVYGFDANQADYQHLLQAWLQCARNTDLLMCHPATEVIAGDAIAQARYVEYQVLKSDWLGGLLQQLPLRLMPMSRCLHSSV